MFRTNLLNTVAFAALVMGRPALKEVENEPEVIEQDSMTGGGGDSTVTAGEGSDTVEAVSADADDDKPVVTAEVYDMDEIADLEPRKRSERIDFGFRDWPVGGHALISADLVDRARGSAQNAKLTNGKDNGKRFITRAAKGLKNKAGELAYPNAKKGDIEVVRIKDEVVEAPAPAAEAPNADETKTLENA